MMTICPCCGMEFHMINSDPGRCANCEELYARDMRDHHYPVGFTYRKELADAGLEQMVIEDWRRVKMLSHDMRIAKTQCDLESRLVEQKKLIEKINNENQGRIRRLTKSKSDFSGIVFY